MLERILEFLYDPKGKERVSLRVAEEQRGTGCTARRPTTSCCAADPRAAKVCSLDWDTPCFPLGNWADWHSRLEKTNRTTVGTWLRGTRTMSWIELKCRSRMFDNRISLWLIGVDRSCNKGSSCLKTVLAPFSVKGPFLRRYEQSEPPAI